MSKADLEQMIADLDPSDPAAADKLMAAVEEAEEGALHDEAPAEKDEKQAGEPSSTESKPKGIATKDGQHIIPYSELETARERAVRAEKMLEDQTALLEELKAGRITPEEVPPVDEEAMTLLEDELPQVAKALRAQQSLLESLKVKVHQYETKEQREQEARQQAEQDTMKAAIAANPTLSAWQEAAFRKENPDATLWDQAAEADALLRSNPAWASKPLSERFARAVAMVEAMNGMTSTTKRTKQADPAAELDAMLGDRSIPGSLSEFPGGTPPAQDDREALANISPHELAARMQDMSPDQVERFLAKHGIATF